MTQYRASRWPLLFFATVVIGIFSGFGGMFLAILLHFLQHLAYEHTVFPILGNESFLFVASVATPSMRVIILLLCGFIAGFGWWAVFRYGRPLVSIASAIKSPRPYMPIKTTVAHVLLQIITVALGSPLGREVAPREFAATFACWLTNKMKLHPKESRILVACAAGAGLAAVYNVPFGGAMFTLEVLLGSFHLFAVIPAITTAAIAVVISWIGLGNQSLYHTPFLVLDTSVVVWAIISGPLFGFTAYWFKEMTIRAQSRAPRDWKIIVCCLLNFFLIGLMSIYFPEILGNGRSAAQLGFDGNMLGLGVAIALFILRVLIVCTSIQAGASGGLLTPSLANGALMAVILGILWNYMWPGISISAFAVIGGAAFLAAAQKMPITAIVLIIEFTGINFSFFIPILLAVAGSISMFHYCAHRRLVMVMS
ncbi:chloride channel protein [Legionella longbeachae]|uniref:Putative chloride channel protein n=1 Tax=Legionella longbeachae serogroup 1 (strain NSW150) TaxID=661367 RepID=D3HNT1_LEGLN|nr:chloride channel protein [Legionella longbeachae]VEE01070.1 chloride channel protein [Legionella oakridgensis]HBD7398488.1 chloride channel protein [Legionella pneumophila]ARB92548.1 chloride channel protein [Legionella longbeachae]ARM34276.1 chloride channel protein [Legionella longbeachae]EEZ96460.1 chloride transporter [Legionella longbeachae D-4968]